MNLKTARWVLASDTRSRGLNLLSCLIALSALTVMPTFSAEERVGPPWPPPEGKLRVIIDTDAACEVDDQHALALALLSPERFEIEGLVAAHYGDAGGRKGIEKSFQEIQTVLAKAGLAGKFPVKRGSHPFQYSEAPEPSEGVDFIIERALDPAKTEPLWVVSLGACTDLAAAWLKEPRIKDRVIAFWHGRTQWPDKCWNFNSYNDLKAVRILFQSRLPLVLFDTGTDLVCPMDEARERIRPYGELGRYLYDIRLRSPAWQSPKKGMFDLGDVAVLVDPSLGKFETVAVPGVNWDMRYDHQRTHGRMIRIHSIDRDGTFGLLESKLKTAYPSAKP